MKERLSRTITCIIIAVMMLGVMTLFPHAAEQAAQSSTNAEI